MSEGANLEIGLTAHLIARVRHERCGALVGRANRHGWEWVPTLVEARCLMDRFHSMVNKRRDKDSRLTSIPPPQSSTPPTSYSS